jgi:hypothetical protein
MSTRPYVFIGKFPNESFDYYLPIAAAVDPTNTDDVVEAVTLSAAPSGVGELTLAGLEYDDVTKAVRATVSGGQPGRIYTLRYGLTFGSGDLRELLATLTVARELRTDRPQVPPARDFGGTIRWPHSAIAVIGVSHYGDGSVYG